MRKKKSDFYDIINDIYKHDEFMKLNDCRHHGITRYDHCLRVSYYTYLITKALHLNYKEATRAALLHDFFTDEVLTFNVVHKITKHPDIAVKNASKYFELSELQKDIIRTHMWPCTFISAIFERGYVTKNSLQTVGSFVFMFIISKFR